ncbi:hypothetical protein KIW84_051925 [Lathyrus oleraceus]|uniref:Uncharacterized protein n=1 Tax=Pisum sativum TaxID=3888 RepID=A0A9D5AEE0_PEA|nr:hypothetical protein KIW84_051925 [Pisum sativum]
MAKSVNARLAQSETDILHEAVKKKKGSQYEAVRILTTRRKAQLFATFNRYRETHGTSITKCIEPRNLCEFDVAGMMGLPRGFELPCHSFYSLAEP